MWSIRRRIFKRLKELNSKDFRRLRITEKGAKWLLDYPFFDMLFPDSGIKIEFLNLYDFDPSIVINFMLQNNVFLSNSGPLLRVDKVILKFNSYNKVKLIYLFNLLETVEEQKSYSFEQERFDYQTLYPIVDVAFTCGHYTNKFVQVVKSFTKIYIFHK